MDGNKPKKTETDRNSEKLTKKTDRNRKDKQKQRKMDDKRQKP